MRKALVTLTIAVLAFIAAFTTYLYFRQAHGTVEIRITRAMIDDALARKFPKEKTYLEVLRVSYENPTVAFLPDTKSVRVTLDARVELGVAGLFAKAYRGTATVNTQLGYNPDRHQFFLWQPVVEGLDIPKLKSNYRDILRDGLNFATAEWAKEIPVYQLKDTDTPQHLAKLLLRRIEVDHDGITLSLAP